MDAESGRVEQGVVAYAKGIELSALRGEAHRNVRSETMAGGVHIAMSDGVGVVIGDSGPPRESVSGIHGRSLNRRIITGSADREG